MDNEIFKISRENSKIVKKPFLLDNIVYDYFQYEYNKNGDLVKSFDYDISGELISEEKYEYSEDKSVKKIHNILQGVCTQETVVTYKDEKVISHVQTYLLTKDKDYNPDMYTKIYCEYDLSNRIRKKTTYNGEDEFIESSEFEYITDKLYNVTVKNCKGQTKFKVEILDDSKRIIEDLADNSRTEIHEDADLEKIVFYQKKDKNGNILEHYEYKIENDTFVCYEIKGSVELKTIMNKKEFELINNAQSAIYYYDNKNSEISYVVNPSEKTILLNNFEINYTHTIVPYYLSKNCLPMKIHLNAITKFETIGGFFDRKLRLKINENLTLELRYDKKILEILKALIF